MENNKFKILNELGYMYLKLNKIKEAKQNFENALKENDKNEMPYIGLSEIEIINKNLKKAEEFINIAESINPNNLRLKLVKAKLFYEKNELNKAYELLKEILNKNIENIEAITLLLKVSFKIEKYEDVEKVLKDYYKNHPEDKNIQYALGVILYLQDKLNEALSIIPENNELKEIIEKKLKLLKEEMNGKN